MVAAEAIPPPAACVRMETMSQPMNCKIALVCWMAVPNKQLPREDDTYSPSVPTRSQSRTLLSEIEDDVLDAQVKASGQEGRRQNQATDLHLEAVLGPGVLIHHQAPAVSDRFKSASYGDDGRESADFRLPSYDDLGEEAYREDDQKDDVAA